MSEHVIITTPEQDKALNLIQRNIDHAYQPAGPRETLHIYEAEDTRMILWSIAADGEVTKEACNLSPEGWWEVES